MLPLLSDLPEPQRPDKRVLGHWRGTYYRKGEVAGVGTLQGIDVAYLMWDRHGPLAASSDTVVASALVVLDVG